MPTIYVDQSSVNAVHVATPASDNTELDVQATLIPVLVPDTDMNAWLAAYDSSEAYSPSAADSRIIARAVLDALSQFVNGG